MQLRRNFAQGNLVAAAAWAYLRKIEDGLLSKRGGCLAQLQASLSGEQACQRSLCQSAVAEIFAIETMFVCPSAMILAHKESL